MYSRIPPQKRLGTTIWIKRTSLAKYIIISFIFIFYFTLIIIYRKKGERNYLLLIALAKLSLA